MLYLIDAKTFYDIEIMRNQLASTIKNKWWSAYKIQSAGEPNYITIINQSQIITYKTCKWFNRNEFSLWKIVYHIAPYFSISDDLFNEWNFEHTCIISTYLIYIGLYTSIQI